MEDPVPTSQGIDAAEKKGFLSPTTNTSTRPGKAQTSVEVLDRDDASFRALYTGSSPEQAVIAAYAQSRGDYNTWEYQRKYLWMLRRHANSVSCGTFCALKEAVPGTRTTPNGGRRHD